MNRIIDPNPDPLSKWLNKLRQYRCLSCHAVFVGSGPMLFVTCPKCGKRELEDTGVIIRR